MASSDTHVLVTGGAGYLGSVLCGKLLSRGYLVTVVDNLLYRQHSLFGYCHHGGFDFVNGDARDERIIRGLVERADIIIPLAAIVGAPACDKSPELAQAVNVEAVNLLNSLRSPSQLIVFPMTNSGYGITSNETVCTEDSPLKPVSLYGRTKVFAEERLLESGNVITLRLATVFGMSPRLRLDLLVNHFTHAAYTDRYIIIFEKHFRRNFVHIQDVADCFIHCIENAGQMAGRPYNVGSDELNLTKEDLALAIKKHVPDFHIHFASIGSDPDKRDYMVSNERLRQAGFSAKRSLDDGIEELLKGFRMMAPHSFRNA